MVDKSPCEPGFNNSEVGVAWDDERLPKVESKGWDEESSAPEPPVLGDDDEIGSLNWCWCLADELDPFLCFLFGSCGVVTPLLFNCLCPSARIKMAWLDILILIIKKTIAIVYTIYYYISNVT